MIGARIYLYIGLAVAVVAGAGAIYVVGRSDGSNKSLRQSLEDTIEQYRSWDNAANKIGNSDDVDLCVRNGGLRDECANGLRDQKAAEGE